MIRTLPDPHHGSFHADLVPALDHVVVNVASALDEAVAQFARLGFRLTERGHHSLGSSNNLAIFGKTYLELLGYEPGRPQLRTDLWGHPLGLTGLVFRSHDPDREYEAMRTAGLEASEPMHFSRPVGLAEGVQDARFAVVRLAPDLVPNGRIFFCHHKTPELVWRAEWQAHPNGAVDIAEFVIISRDPARSASLHARLFGEEAVRPIDGGQSLAAGPAQVSITSRDAAFARFGDALPALPEDGSDRMVALVVRTRSADEAQSALATGGIPGRAFEGGWLVAAADAANVALALRP